MTTKLSEALESLRDEGFGDSSSEALVAEAQAPSERYEKEVDSHRARLQDFLQDVYGQAHGSEKTGCSGPDWPLRSARGIDGPARMAETPDCCLVPALKFFYCSFSFSKAVNSCTQCPR